MTYKEALKLNESSYLVDNQGFTDNKLVNANRLAIEALEKQIPKKPKIAIYGNRIKSEQEVMVCPCCGDSWNCNEYGSGMKYCWECGQAIDWNEVTE